ncbi:MAG: MAPEG family protein [Proteobacteria bacterium]|nr:MAPEG family protein [Pseudomonadota bacterium]
MDTANTTAIILPLVGMAALTALVQLLIPVARVGSVRRGEVTIDDFILGESGRVPPRVSIPNRNYMNLLEFPVLLYPACLIAYIATDVSGIMVAVAWAFVALRTVHSAIHLTYNRVSHRVVAFGLSNVAMVTLWVLVTQQLVNKSGIF